MTRWVVTLLRKLVKRLISMGKGILGARVLVMGMTFKENVADIRNSKVVDIINELKDLVLMLTWLMLMPIQKR